MTLREILKEFSNFLKGDALDPTVGMDEDEAIEAIKKWAIERIGGEEYDNVDQTNVREFMRERIEEAE